MPDPRPANQAPDVADFDRAIQAHLDRMASLRFPDATVPVFCACDPWPPSAETTLAEGPAYGYSISLRAFPDGHLAVVLTPDDGAAPLDVRFQRIIPSRGGSFVAWITVKDEQVTLRVGGLLGPYSSWQDPLELPS